jgi:hypothetical protein
MYLLGSRVVTVGNKFKKRKGRRIGRSSCTTGSVCAAKESALREGRPKINCPFGFGWASGRKLLLLPCTSHPSILQLCCTHTFTSQESLLFLSLDSSRLLLFSVAVLEFVSPEERLSCYVC